MSAPYAAVPSPSPAPDQRRSGGSALSLFRRRIDAKIVLPYLLLMFVVAVVLTFVAVNLVAGSLEEKFQEELAGAGRSANEAMVLLEEHQLAVLRQMVFTVGVDAAIQSGDQARLRELLAPIAANYRLAYLDVVDGQGSHLMALRSSALGDRATSTVDPDLAGWEPVRKALWDPPDPLGDKHADVVRTSWGRLLVSAAPVKLDEAVVGVIAIALPLQEVATRLSQEAGSRGITLYDQTGTALESTLRVSSQSLAALQVAVTDRERVLTTDQILFRRAQVGSVQYVEALSVLAVRQRPVLLMGVGNLVAIIEERGQQARSMLVAIFSGVVMVVLAVGIAIARRLTRPVHALVEATRRVRNNQLDFDVPVETEDEHGLLTAAFNDMRRGLIERERSREAIERYMSPKVYELIQTGELSMGGSRREITVFKSDIRDFTSLSEQMEPEQIVAYLNRYFERMVKPIADRAGEVDKYMGDSILAKFGATVWYPDHARRAVLAMVEIAEACEALNRELAAEGLPTVYTRVGANTGDAVVGNIGSTQRLEYTIISDTVNVAQRVEELGKDVGWDLLISEQTYAQASDAVEVGEPWAVRLRGRTQDTLVYPVLGRSGAVPAGRRRAYQQLLRSASGTAGERRRETDARLAPTPQPPRSA